MEAHSVADASYTSKFVACKATRVTLLLILRHTSVYNVPLCYETHTPERRQVSELVACARNYFVMSRLSDAYKELEIQ